MKPLWKNHKPQDDSELLKKYLSTGDLELLGTLYNRYIHLVYGVCLKYFKDREKSKDAVNEIFEKLIKEVSRFEIQKFRSWLYVLVKNHCLMEIRRARNEQKRFDQFSHDRFMESVDITHPIDEERDDALEERLIQCMEKLKQEQYSCIRLFYYENCCYKEIAGKLGIEEKKVKSYIQNGKRNLKICLEQNRKQDEI
jgi:RNA polymerase sigma-70 factor (ECF subfamily)